MQKITGILFLLLALASCNNNPGNNAIPNAGITDSTAIAQDTATQMALENSYEYLKTLNASEKLAYDVIAFGGSASEGEYAIIRRGPDNKPDTIAHGGREGIILNTFMADLNNNGHNDIYIILQSADSNRYGNVIAYEIDKQGKAAPLIFPEPLKEDNTEGYRGKDSIYIDGGYLIRRFPVYKEKDQICCPTGGWLNVHYVLNKNEFGSIKW